MYCLFFHELLPARMTPVLFILLAPPSVGFVSYSSLSGELCRPE
jgi:tellurite resistance protein